MQENNEIVTTLTGGTVTAGGTFKVDTGTTTTACNNFWPSYPYVSPTIYTYPSYQTVTFDFGVARVANGFLVRHQGQDYVFENEVNLLAFMKKALKDGKKN